MSKVLAETPVNLISPVLFSFVLYWAIGLYPTADRFFFFMLACALEVGRDQPGTHQPAPCLPVMTAAAAPW